MRERSCTVLSFLFLLAVSFVPAASALEADPEIVAAPDKTPYVMTVFGLRKAFPVAADRIRLELGSLSDREAGLAWESYRIVSDDDPEFAAAKNVRPLGVSGGRESFVSEVSRPISPTASYTPTYGRADIELKLHAPMKPGCTYSVIAADPALVHAGGRTGVSFRYDHADLDRVPDRKHAPELQAMTVYGLRGLEVVGRGVIRLEFGAAFNGRNLSEKIHVKLKGEPAGIKAVGIRETPEFYESVGLSVPKRTDVFLQLDRIPAEGDTIRVEADSKPGSRPERETGPGSGSSRSESPFDLLIRGDDEIVHGTDSAAIVFSDRHTFSSAVKVNQVGYIASGPKKALLGRWTGSLPQDAVRYNEPPEFELRDAATHETVFAGQCTFLNSPEEPVKARSASETRGLSRDELLELRAGEKSEAEAQRHALEFIREIDFSAFTKPGLYYVAVPGIGRSFDFAIAEDVYGEAFRTMADGVFARRCGMALEPPYSIDWYRPACHDGGVRLTSQEKIGGEKGIRPENVLLVKNESPEASARPSIWNDPALIARFPFNGSAENVVKGGMKSDDPLKNGSYWSKPEAMKLTPLYEEAAPTFRTEPNLIWDGPGNGVYAAASKDRNGWKGRLEFDRTKGISFAFWAKLLPPESETKEIGRDFMMTVRPDDPRQCTFSVHWDGRDYASFSMYGKKFEFWTSGSSLFSSPGAWCHCVQTFEPVPGTLPGEDAQSGGGEWKYRIYIDGRLRQTLSTTLNEEFGGSFCFGDVSSLAGTILLDELLIYNRVLTPDEAAKLAERVGGTVPKRIPASGGHHDAGVGSPRSHLDVAQTLMDAYELAPEKFADGQLNIPEKDNGIPDILDEALWELKLWTGLQDADGGVHNGTASVEKPSGARETRRRNGVSPVPDPDDCAFEKDSQGALYFAGAMAQASRLLKSAGKMELSADCLDCARRAYDWGVGHKPETEDGKLFLNFHTIPLAYAAAQLYHATGEKEYHEAFLGNSPWRNTPDTDLIAEDGSRDWSLPAFAYAAIPAGKADAAVHAAVTGAVFRLADRFAGEMKPARTKYARHPYAPGSWDADAYRHFQASVRHAWKLAEDEGRAASYREAMIRAADDLLGCNPVNTGFVAGLGAKTIHAPYDESRFRPAGFAVRGVLAPEPSPAALDEVRNRSSVLLPRFSYDNPAKLYVFADTVFADGPGEGVVSRQADVMALFGLLLPDGAQRK